jgi:hypothetical protein
LKKKDKPQKCAHLFIFLFVDRSVIFKETAIGLSNHKAKNFNALLDYKMA